MVMMVVHADAVLLLMVMMVVMVLLFLILVIIMVMVVVMLFFLVLIIVVMVAAALLILVIIMVMVVMVLLFLILVMVVIVLMLVFFHALHDLPEHLLLHVVGTGNDIQQLGAGQLCHGSRDDGGIRIVLSHDGHGFLHLLLIGDIGSGQNHRACVLDLVVEEFAEVPGIHLRLLGVHHGDCRVKLHIHALRDSLDGTDDIGKLAYAAGLDDDAVRMVGIHNLLQGCLKISHQRAADAALVHLADLNTGLLQETAVDADFAEFILNQHHLLFPQSLIQKLLDKCCLSGAQKAGYDIYLCHDSLPPS